MSDEPKQYCVYCGHIRHRCDCHKRDSRIRRFMLCGNPARPFIAKWQPQPYKRGVPPQIKHRERATLRKYYKLWFTMLSNKYGHECAHCGTADNLVLDHVVPLAKGGLSHPDNLQLLCASCNNLKGKLTFDCRKHD